MDSKRKPSKNVVNASEEPTNVQRARRTMAPMLDVAMDAQKRGEPMAKRERPPLPNWYTKERYGYKRSDAKSYANRYWKGAK